MKRVARLRHLRVHGCVLKREGRSRSLWTNAEKGRVEAVPRPTAIADLLTRWIFRGLRVPEVA